MNFIEYIRREKLFKNLIKRYEKRLDQERDIIYLRQFKKSIQNLPEFTLNHENKIILNNFNVIVEDILGKRHEKKIKNDHRKKVGIFYTPASIVSNILNAVNYTAEALIENKKIIDISCGSGSFLIQVLLRLMLRYLKINRIKHPSELSLEQVSEFLEIAKNNIHGLDLDSIACILCQINLHFLLFSWFKSQLIETDQFKFPFFNMINGDIITFDFHDKYDIVIGNPPYIFLRDLSPLQRELINQRNFKTTRGQYDYYHVFIEIGLNILKDNGLLGFILPDSLLALSNRKILRKFIYQETKIKEIQYLETEFEDPIVSNIILILEKEKNPVKKRNNNIHVIIKKDTKIEQKFIPQKLIETWSYNFLIDLDQKDIEILNYLSTFFPSLKKLMNTPGFEIMLSRGVELTKEGKVIYCNNCKKYMPFPRKTRQCKNCGTPLDLALTEKIITEHPSPPLRKDYESFVYSIKRYKITKYKFINTLKQGINYKNPEIYKDRIIIRQLGEKNLICAAWEPNYSLTSQSFYNLKILKSPIAVFDHLYLLGLLNSKLLSYFFRKSFGSYKRLFPRILIEKIKSLPIKVPTTEKEQNLGETLRKKVKMFMNQKNITEASEKLQEQIDTIVFSLYGLSQEEREHVLQVFIPTFKI
ncbi:MAG: Eco57I restriction-modification methylase domain-containing protein [Promethearchaeota archaeon]